MANSSSTVSTTDVITAAQYNDLRTDAIGPYGASRNFPDNIKTTYGTGATDGEIYSSGSSWIFDSIGGFDIEFKVSGSTKLTVTSSGFSLTGNQLFDDNEKIIMGTGSDAEIFFDATDLVINPDAVGSGVLKVGSTVEIEAGANLRFGAVTALVDNPAGTMTLSNIDALDATTEATIEAAIDTLANLTAAAALVTVSTITTGVWSATDIAVAAGGTGSSTASGARTNLGLAIGSDVQAWDADLDAFALLTAPTGAVVGTTDAQTLTNKVIAAGSNTISGLTHGSEVDNPTSGVHGAVGTIVGTSDSLTLTNKTIAMASNTITGTAALFNTALTDDTFTFISDTLAVFAATTSLQLLGVISDETGTGSLVFGTAPTLASPTISTSPSATGSTWDDLGTVTTIDINGGTIDGATIGGASAGAGTFTTLSITSFGANWTNASRTVADLGIVTTVDINGGSIDGAIIGAASPAAITGTTITGDAIVVGATERVHFDGSTGGDTYIFEQSADDLHIVVGGLAMMTFDQDLLSIGAFSGAPSVDVSFNFETAEYVIGDNDNAFGAIFDKTVAKTSAAYTGATRGIKGNNSVGASNNQNWSNTVGLRGVEAQVNSDASSTGIITGGAAFYGVAASEGGATFTNVYGIFLEAQTVGDNNYGIVGLGGSWQMRSEDYLWIGPDSAATGFVDAFTTVGLVINQEANDDAIITLKSSDVAHPITDLAEADTYAEFSKFDGGAGGLEIRGFKDAGGLNSSAIDIFGLLGEAADTSDTSTSDGVIRLRSMVTDGGASVGVVADAGNMLTMVNNTTTHWLIKGNGDVHQTTDAHTALDYLEDSEALRAYSQVTSPDAIIRNGWDDFVRYNEQDLIDMKVLGSEGRHGLTNTSQLTRLLVGDSWQKESKIRELQRDVLNLTTQLNALTEAK